MTLKEIRNQYLITQAEAASILKISLRSYKSYELDASKQGTWKYTYYVETLSKKLVIDENKGILKVDTIKKVVVEILDRYSANFCYLFGPYAREKAKGKTPVDLLIDTDVSGLDFYAMADEMKNRLNKEVNAVKISHIENDPDTLREILKFGIKIYG